MSPTKKIAPATDDGLDSKWAKLLMALARKLGPRIGEFFLERLRRRMEKRRARKEAREAKKRKKWEGDGGNG